MNSAHWWVVRVHITNVTLEPISNYLFEIGSLGCIEDGDLLIAYFPGERDLEVLRFDVAAYLSELQALGLTRYIPEFIIERLGERDWNSAWKQAWRPLHLSERMVVKPSWEPYSPSANEIVIEIDPKQAFGTGTHATTQLCLRALEHLIHGGEQVLDIGTGTGILSIAAVNLGAQHALAIDVDRQAVQAAKENVAMNRLEAQIEIREMQPHKLEPRRFDIIVANLNHRLIVTEILPRLPSHMGSGSRAVFSGILDEEMEVFLRKLAEWDLVCEAVERQEEWAAPVVRAA